jgi:hypothetical protein
MWITSRCLTATTSLSLQYQQYTSSISSSNRNSQNYRSVSLSSFLLCYTAAPNLPASWSAANEVLLPPPTGSHIPLPTPFSRHASRVSFEGVCPSGGHSSVKTTTRLDYQRLPSPSWMQIQLPVVLSSTKTAENVHTIQAPPHQIYSVNKFLRPVFVLISTFTLRGSIIHPRIGRCTSK